MVFSIPDHEYMFSSEMYMLDGLEVFMLVFWLITRKQLTKKFVW